VASGGKPRNLLGRLRPRSAYDVVAVLALVVALGGGTAFAAFVVSSNSQIGPNTISGSKKPAGFANDNIANGSVDTPDLAPNARAHRIEYSAPSGSAEATIATGGQRPFLGQMHG
jgi:hypothetical protein